ncbi:MATE family efflux transporter [Adlercreutzia sp. R21]|uniref:Multidrug export protein MepA n=1 Tax=Adlercreutzia wanghongyangiae TaxID=3111451 RepID=A0ABU6IJV9_9ACTN|nr:MATE family efflux transporter [Adlercreutzia sp. R21]MEC4176757.1 MATE family efflux transporter [Adlercreutzia sp. R7]MEC4184681.1 MATE family efflux transporter [Adlercreutzia sp. R21]
MPVDMSKHFSTSALLRFTLPTIAMMIFTSCYTIVDGFFVSNYAGKTALAAVNLILPPVMMLASFGMMIGTGGSALVAKTLGEGNEARARRHFSLLVIFAFVLGSVLAIGGWFFMEPTAAVLGATGQMAKDATLYGRMMMISMPFFILQYAFQSFFVTAGRPKYGFMVIVVAGVTNILLDFLFVGLFGWGLPGAALATNIGELIGGGIPLVYFARKRSTPLYFVRPHLRWPVIGKACANGSSEMVTNIAMSLVGILYNWQLLRFIGEDGVAAYGVIMYTAMVFAAVFMGYSIGSSPLLSFQYGAGNHTEMRSLLWKSLGMIAIASVVMFLLGQELAGPLSAIFVSYDADLLELTTKAYRLYALCFLFMGFAIYASAFFTALNNGLVSALISFLRTLVFQVAAVIVLPMIFGIDGIWLSVTVGDALTCLVAATFMIALSGRYGYRKRGLSPKAQAKLEAKA